MSAGNAFLAYAQKVLFRPTGLVFVGANEFAPTGKTLTICGDVKFISCIVDSISR